MIPRGLCQCGCGARTTIATKNNTRDGYVKGEPRRYLDGHSNRKSDRFRIVDMGYETPCWVWQLGRNEDGYGLVADGGRSRKAHVVSYEQLVGPVPGGLELDHLCRVRACVNPTHLEPVTHDENIRRQLHVNALKTHCKHGHPFDEANTILRGGKRSCRACANRRSREYQARRRSGT